MILPPDSLPIDHYNAAELIILRNRINALLPKGSIEDIDLESELVFVYNSTKELLADSGEEALNHKASLTNSLTSTLKHLAALQKDLYTATRLQKFERALAVILKGRPELMEEYISELSS